MYIVNAGPGFKKMLWPAAQKFLDAKTIGKINVKDMALGILLFIPFLLLSGYSMFYLLISGFGAQISR